MALDYSLEELLLEKEDPDSKLIDLTLFDEWHKPFMWDIVGVLGCVPRFKKVEDLVQYTITLFQTQNESVEIEFNTDEADNKMGQVPILQRLGLRGPGSIIFIRHIKPTRKGEAGLCKPFDRKRKLFDHRTIFAIDATDTELESMRNGKLDHFTIHQRASVIPPPVRDKKRGLIFPFRKDERVAIKALIPVAQRFRYHYSRIDKSIETSEVNESKMAQYIRTVHSKITEPPTNTPIDQLDNMVNQMTIDGNKEKTVRTTSAKEQENKANAIKLKEMLLDKNVVFDLLTFTETDPNDLVKYLKLPSE